VTLPNRDISTLYETRVMGEKAASIGRAPAGAWLRLPSAASYPRPTPIPSSMETLAPASTVNKVTSGFMISTSCSGTSSPFTVFGPVTSSRTTRGSCDGTCTESFFRFSSTSTVGSTTPGILASALRTPSILTHDTAAPGTIDSSVRRSEFPTVSA
jgi:hypothetical protein